MTSLWLCNSAKMTVGRLGKVTFLGRTVKLREANALTQNWWDFQHHITLTRCSRVWSILWSILHGWSSQVSDPDSIQKTNKGIYKPPTNRLDMFSTSNMSSTRRNNMHDRAKWQNATELGFVFHKILKSSSYSHRIPQKKRKITFIEHFHKNIPSKQNQRLTI